MKTIAVYAGTFDPITFGHLDLIQRAAQLFDSIILAIASNPTKKPLFSLEERVSLAKEVLVNQKNIKIQGFTGLLLELVKQTQANVIIRGIRAVADFDYEFQLANVNRFMNPEVESIFLMPSDKYMYISATMVREIASLGGSVVGFVPEPVVHALNKKFTKG